MIVRMSNFSKASVIVADAVMQFDKEVLKIHRIPCYSCTLTNDMQIQYYRK